MIDHMQRMFALIRPYLADAGRVAYASALALACATLLLELFAPGIVGNYVTPQHLVAVAAVAAAMSLLDDAPTSALRLSAHVLALAALTVVACSATWRYLDSIPDARVFVTVTVGCTTLLAAAAYARSVRKP